MDRTDQRGRDGGRFAVLSTWLMLLYSTITNSDDNVERHNYAPKTTEIDHENDDDTDIEDELDQRSSGETIPDGTTPKTPNFQNHMAAIALSSLLRASLGHG